MMYKEKTECICCASNKLKTILDLKTQPLANGYHDGKKLNEYPLKLNLCAGCYHLQLSHIVNPDLLFKNYLYVSGTTQTLHDYFDWFAEWCVRMRGKKVGKVLDIACNDGSQLNAFKALSWETYGVDPAENLYDFSSKNNIIECGYFNSSCFDSTIFDVITAQNVFAHTEDALGFLNDCDKKMDEDSLLFIQTSQSEMIQNNQFDTIYHEHLSFFNINSFEALVSRTNLSLVDVKKVSVHGISYVFVLRKGKRSQLENLTIQNLIDVETTRGLLSDKTYDQYSTKVNSIVCNFKSCVEKFREDGYNVVGYGAAAKGMTLLNFADVKLDYIIDDNPMKHGLLTPGTDTIIVSVDKLKEHSENDKILFVPLAWNFFDEILKRIKSVRNNKNDKSLRYFPDVFVAELSNKRVINDY